MSTDQPTYIQKPFFPHSLFVALLSLNNKNDHQRTDVSESVSGKNLLKSIIREKLKSINTDFKTIKYEKPSASVDGLPVSVSFSHTPDAVCAAVSRYWVIGIDMESVDRKVNERLASRMKHNLETLKFYEEHPIIQIWTMKEAALKAIGTGLRKPMNSIKLEPITNSMFKVEFFNGTSAKICSFKENKQWISICFISSELSSFFLSKSYVPIHSGRD